MENILKYLFPPKCLFCGKIGDIFCETCLAECSLLENQYCIVCDKPSENGCTHNFCQNHEIPSRTICIYSYADKVRDCIKFSKYGAKQFMSLKKLCTEAAIICLELWGKFGVDLCLPVPSSPKKLQTRGFNQANMVAEEISRVMNLNLRKDILVRTRSTEAQHSKGRIDRRSNLAGAFGVNNKSSLENKKILLVDDICTTGATFLECSRALYEAGVDNVQCFALSKRLKIRAPLF